MFGKRMTFAFASSAVLAMVIGASPALACKGSTVLFKDDFSKVNRAWTKWSNFGLTFTIDKGKMLIKVPANEWGFVFYNGKFFPDADLCVDVVLPNVDDVANKWAGIGFDNGDDGTYLAAINFEGTVVVQKSSRDGWLEPIPDTQSDAVKTGPNAVNQIRVVWKSTEPAVSFYVNDMLIDTFDVDPSRGRKIGFGLQTGGAGTVEFRNLVVTKP